MASDEDRLQAKVANLNASLDELETQLDPLFAKSLPETLVGLETIQQAKLQVALPYVLYDLVFGAYSLSNISSPIPAHRI
jgi:exosome complex protein LRP1